MFESLRRKAIEEKIEFPEFVQFVERDDLNTVEEIEKSVNMYSREYNLTKEDARDFINYCKNLDLRPADFKNRDILDVGGGTGGFKKAAEKLRIAKSVVNIDPLEILLPKQKEGRSVRGRAETLPFKGESFDIVLAHASVPWVLAGQGRFEDIPNVVREMLRVTRKGGVVKMSSIGGFEGTFSQKTMQQTARMTREVLSELTRLHQENSSLRVKVVKINRKDALSQPSFTYLLEVGK